MPDAGTARALDAYFVVGAEHGLNASTFTARVITSTRSDIASAVTGAIGAMKGPLHGGAPSEVVEQIHKVGTPEHAEEWVRDAIARGERLMGFGHRVYRAYDPRARALRTVAESMEHKPDWLELAITVEDVALRVLAELHPERALKTNVEYYAAAVLQGVGLTPDLFPATFALARHAGWTAHVLEQAGANRLIRPDAIYTGPRRARPPGLIARRRSRPAPPYRSGSVATRPPVPGRGRTAGSRSPRRPGTPPSPRGTVRAVPACTTCGADRRPHDPGRVERQVDQVQRLGPAFGGDLGRQEPEDHRAHGSRYRPRRRPRPAASNGRPPTREARGMSPIAMAPPTRAADEHRPEPDPVAERAGHRRQEGPGEGGGPGDERDPARESRAAPDDGLHHDGNVRPRHLVGEERRPEDDEDPANGGIAEDAADRPEGEREDPPLGHDLRPDLP